MTMEYGEGMVEVHCRDCGTSLGAQGGNSEEDIQWELWEHGRCPVQIARALGLNTELYEKALNVTTVAILGAYPEFPNNTIGDTDLDAVRLLRAGIAAECVLDQLGKTGFKVRTA